MSATIDFTTVTNSIAALSITGVTILDSDEIPDTIGLENCVLAPMPAGFISGIEVTRDEITGQKLKLVYTVTFRYYHCKIGGGLGGLFATYSGMLSNMALVLAAFSSDATLTGAMDNQTPTINNVGPVNDPAGNGYHGFDISLRIKQFLEV